MPSSSANRSGQGLHQGCPHWGGVRHSAHTVVVPFNTVVCGLAGEAELRQGSGRLSLALEAFQIHRVQPQILKGQSYSKGRSLAAGHEHRSLRDRFCWESQVRGKQGKKHLQNFKIKWPYQFNLPIYRWRDRGPEKWCNGPKITQLVAGKTRGESGLKSQHSALAITWVLFYLLFLSLSSRKTPHSPIESHGTSTCKTW